MKNNKLLIILLTIIIGIVFPVLLLLITVGLFSLMSSISFIISTILAITLIILIKKVFLEIENKFSISIIKLYMLFEIPPIIIGICYMAYVEYLDSIDYWHGQMFGGLGEFLFAIGYLVAVGVIIVVSISQNITLKIMKKTKN